MPKTVDKKAQLQEAVEYFEGSSRSKDEYMQFMMVVQKVLQQGSGLAWSQVEDILKNTLEK